VVRVVLGTRPADYAITPDDVARCVLEHYPAAHEQERIIVRIVYGYNLGISSRWETKEVNFKPQERAQRMPG